MKQFLLFIAACLITIGTHAQNGTAIKGDHPKYGYKPHPAIKLEQTPLQYKLQNEAASKSTNGINGEWFVFADAIYIDQSSGTWLYPVMPDSTFWVADSVQPFFWYVMGMGVSLDPTSLRFSTEFANLLSSPPSFQILNSDSYTVDSVLVVGRYDHIHPYTDTLYIDVAIADTLNHTFKVTYDDGPNPFFTDSITRGDSKFQCAFAQYDWSTNRVSDSVTPIRRITKILDAAAALDTVQGLSRWTFAIDPPLIAPPGSKVVAQATFASGFNYPFQTPLDSANKWNAYTMEADAFNTFPHQNIDDYNSGLIITTNERYHLNTFYNHQGTAVQSPTYLFPRKVGFDDPYLGFFLTCGTCPTSVAGTASQLKQVTAYPNPASKDVVIEFSSAGNNATINITNTIGQLIHNKTVNTKANEKTIVPFSTTNLTNGIYFFTVEANGQQMVGRFVVAH